VPSLQVQVHQAVSVSCSSHFPSTTDPCSCLGPPECTPAALVIQGRPGPIVVSQFQRPHLRPQWKQDKFNCRFHFHHLFHLLCNKRHRRLVYPVAQLSGYPRLFHTEDQTFISITIRHSKEPAFGLRSVHSRSLNPAPSRPPTAPPSLLLCVYSEPTITSTNSTYPQYLLQCLVASAAARPSSASSSCCE
jgi:hypothetical protein